MILYLVRHGHAEYGGPDDRKCLSSEGRREVARVARLLEARGVEVPRIECSVKTRARETAEILSAAVGPREGVHIREGLRPEDPVGVLAEELRGHDEDRMLVGHLPFMPRLCQALVGDREAVAEIPFRTATVVRLTREAGVWRVDWAVDPDGEK